MGGFVDVLPSFEYYFNSLLITYITGICFEIACVSVVRFVETSYLSFIATHLTVCQEMRNLGVGNLGAN